MKTFIPVLQKNKWTIIFAFVFCLFFIPTYSFTPAYTFTPTYDFTTNVIPSDDRSYVSHAFTLALDFDLDYSNEIAVIFNRDGNMPSHPIGSGILAAPFVAFFSILDRISADPVIGERILFFHSWAFFGFLFSVNFYFLLGIFLYYQSVRKVFTSITFQHLFVIIMSTGTIYYSLVRFTMSHTFEFFVLVLTLWSSIKLYFAIHEGKKAFGWFNLVGFANIANLWIRPANYNALLMPFLILILLSIYYRHNLKANIFLRLFLSIALYWLPYCAFNMRYFHSAFPSIAQVYAVDMGGQAAISGNIGEKILSVIKLSPNIFLLLFSSEFGILYTNPVLIFGLAGLVWMAFGDGSKPKFNARTIITLLLILAYYGFSTAIVLAWRSTGSSYGYRYLFPLIPLAVLGYAYLNQKVKSQILKSVLTIFFIMGITSVFFYNQTSELSPSKQTNVYGRLHEYSAKGYNVTLLKAIRKPITYLATIANSYVGFLTKKLVVETGTRTFFPQPWKGYLQPLKNIPGRVYYQTYILLLLWIFSGFFIDRQLAQQKNP